MSFENFVDWTVSIDCGPTVGIYQGQIKSVDGINQTLTLKHAFHNGILIDEDGSNHIIIKAKDILDLNLLSQPGSSFQIQKTINKRSNHEQSQPQLKAAPIANNGGKSSLSSGNQSTRSRSSKSWSDEAANDNEMNEETTNKFSFDSSNILPIKNMSIVSSSTQIQDKYRCDQMILEHNNGPIDYEQIQLPVPTTKKYLTDEGLIIPAINVELRDRLFASAELHGFSLERRIESMGRCTSDMCLHLLGGTQRLLVKNRHQHPTIVVLACTTEIQGAYAICAARILASRNITIYLYLQPPSNQSNQNRPSFIENELKLFRTTQGIINQNAADLPRSPIDLIINGLDAANNSDSVLFAKPWYRDVVQYCSRLQASVIGVDPPLGGGAIECKYSLVPLLPLVDMSSKNVGRLYLCDLGLGQKVFQHLQIRYASPFGGKSFVALHNN